MKTCGYGLKPQMKSCKNAQTHDAVGKQTNFVFHMTQLEAISQQLYFSWERGAPSPCAFRWATQHVVLQNEKRWTSPVIRTL